MSVFDILVLVLPLTIRGRLILKELWQLVGQAWDKPVPDKNKCSFEDFSVASCHNVQDTTFDFE